MFTKYLAIIFSILVTASYVIGFIYDSSFLDEFGINYYEIMGSPLDYLSIGGMYLLFSIAEHLMLLFGIFGLVGILYIPIKRRLRKNSIEKILDFESLPYILLSLIPFVLLLLLPVGSDSTKLAAELKSQSSDVACIEGEPACLKGEVLRYRDSKLIFYNSESKETAVYPDGRVISVTHG